MNRFFLLLLLAIALPVAYSQSNVEDATLRLAQLLVQKGTLKTEDIQGLIASAPSERMEALSNLLVARGVLTAQDKALLLGETKLAVARPAPASAPAPVPSPVPVRSAAPAAKSLPVAFHGSMMFNAFSNLGYLNIQDVPLFSNRAGVDNLSNDKSFGMTFRQSRIGMKVQDISVGGMKLTGTVEFDFFGGKAALPPGEHMELPRLRLAFVRLDGKRHSFIVGQDWNVFAPLNPISLAAYSIPAYAGGGNPWIRLPQLRYENRMTFRGDTNLTWQLAITDPNMGDHPLNAFLTSRVPGVGERGRLPGFENRFQFGGTLGGRKASLGLAGRYGRGLNTAAVNNQVFRRSIDSWGTAIDYTIPLGTHWTLMGELFAGRALGGYSSSIGQAVLPPSGVGGGGVFSRGGWSQLQWQLNPVWGVNFAYGIDAMRARDLRVGDRLSNGGPMVNTVLKFADRWTAALEWRRLDTRWYQAPSANEAGDQFSLSLLWVL